MSFQFYNPFEELQFNNDICFLSGVDLNEINRSEIMIFPQWILNEYDLNEKQFKMMDAANSWKYNELKLPCTIEVAKAYEKLETYIENIFQQGFVALKNIDQHQLFLWVGKIVYGVLYYEMILEEKLAQRKKVPFAIHEELKEKYELFHLTLQSLIGPIKFGDTPPWSFTFQQINYTQNIFNYRDDAVNLMFSLSMKDFGIIACFQDGGLVKKYLNEILSKIGETKLHAIQFEEVCAKSYYANYLLKRKPAYSFSKSNNNLMIHTEQIPLVQLNSCFLHWDEKMYAQVLAGYWKPWGLTEKEIYKFEQAISYLEDVRTYQLIDPTSIKLPT